MLFRKPPTALRRVKSWLILAPWLSTESIPREGGSRQPEGSGRGPGGMGHTGMRGDRTVSGAGRALLLQLRGKSSARPQAEPWLRLAAAGDEFLLLQLKKLSAYNTFPFLPPQNKTPGDLLFSKRY